MSARSVPAGYHLSRVMLKGTREPVPAWAIHRDADYGVIGYALQMVGSTRWATLSAGGGPSFRSTYGLRTRHAAIVAVIAAADASR